MIRSPREIAFRLRQETANLMLWLHSPAPRLDAPSPLPGLPDPQPVIDALRGSDFARQVVDIAESVLAHRFPLLGLMLETGPGIHWRRDYVHGIESDLRYFRRLAYLDPAQVGDHKIVWELNRHQHLVLLAQAWRFTGRRDFLEEVRRQLASWFSANPAQRGINWCSALEVAFRVLSWIWLQHLAGPELPERFLGELYRHGRHLEENLSWYFSPNTHLLGEAVALEALGALFPHWPRARIWLRMGGDAAAMQINRQIRGDGSHFEQSSYYHLYAMDMLMFHALFRPENQYRIAGMADYLAALMGPSRSLPLIGDDDGGRFFHPFGDRAGFGRASLATASVLLGSPKWAYCESDLHEQAAWWLGAVQGSSAGEPLPSRFFPDAGSWILTSGQAHAVVDAGPFGSGSAGHSHSDTLSLMLRLGEQEILVDAGTYTYMGPERNSFRGSAGHNIIRVDEVDQALPAGPFRWRNPPGVVVHHAEERSLDAEVITASGMRHRRHVEIVGGTLVITDYVSGVPGEHSVEQFWRLGDVAAAKRFQFDGGGELDLIEDWRSLVLGHKIVCPMLVRKARAVLPLYWITRISLV